MSGAATRTVALVLTAGFVVLVFLLMLLPEPRTDLRASANVTRPGGRRALVLLLEELGFDPLVWDRAPGHLPRGEGVVVLPAAPADAPAYYEALGPGAEARETEEPVPPDAAEPPRVAPAGDGGRRLLHDPRHYVRFLEEGGIVVAERDEVAGAFAELGVDDLPTVAPADSDDEPVERTVAFRAGDPLVVRWRESSRFEELPLGSPVEVLAEDEHARPVLVAVPVGRGRLVLLPEDDFLDNERLGEADHALFLVRALEALRAGGRLLFDEYCLGGWVPETPLQLAFSPSNAPVSAHVLLVVVLALWCAGRARAFPRDPEPLAQVSALARARALADLLSGARRWDVLARMLRLGVLRRLGSRARGALDSGYDGELVPPSPELVAELLAPYRARLGGADRLGHAERLLAGDDISGEEGLERLGAQLASLERHLIAVGPTTEAAPHG